MEVVRICEFEDHIFEGPNKSKEQQTIYQLQRKHMTMFGVLGEFSRPIVWMQTPIKSLPFHSPLIVVEQDG